MAQVEKENVDLDVAEQLHQRYRLVFISSAWFRPLLSGFSGFLCDLTTGSAGSWPQFTPSGGWRRAQNLKAATSSRVGSPSRSPCPSSSSPGQLLSLHLLLLSHIKSRCAGASQRGEGGLHGARHPRHHAQRSLGGEREGDGGEC